MNGFIFAPKFNHHGNDATGAFHPGTEIYADLFDLPKAFLFDNHNHNSKKLRESIYHKIQAATVGPLDCVAYFGHGYPDQLVSADIFAGDVPDFAKYINGNANQGIQILLYACLSGAQPEDLVGHIPKYYTLNKKTHYIEHNHHRFTECFAAALSKQLAHKDATVYGHTTSAHTFKNPRLRKYQNGIGSWVVDPSDGKKWKQWSQLIMSADESSRHNCNSILWAKFPWMSDDQFNRALEMEEDLLGRWEITIDGKISSHYVFLNNGRVVKTDPKHQVKQLCDPGYWDYSATSVVVNWSDTADEVWNPPLSKTRQTGTSADYTLTAKKLASPKHDPKEKFGVKWTPNRLGKKQPHYALCQVKDWF